MSGRKIQIACLRMFWQNIVRSKDVLMPELYNAGIWCAITY